MIDEIDYFPKRDKYKKNKAVDDDWQALKKIKSGQDAKTRKPKKPSPKPPGEGDSPTKR